MAPALQMAARRAAPRVLTSVSQQIRGMATEKQIFNQIKATKNIQKITSSMKMVSAAKLKGDETRLAKAIPFNKMAYALCPEPVDLEFATYEELPQKCLLVPFTSDKGLCGGINSFISRGTRNCVRKLAAQGKDCDVVVIGDKGRGQMRRFIPEKIVRSATDIVSPGTFALASALAVELVSVGAMEYDAVVLIYNSYVNPAVYKQKYKVVPPFAFEKEDEVAMPTYEFDSDKVEAMVDLYEFILASQIFHSFIDGAAAEQSSRMTAMENASKNAGEIISALTLKYNRARQARITTELIEIISGASALEE